MARVQRLVLIVVLIAGLAVASSAVLWVQTREAAAFGLLSRALDRAGTFAVAARGPGVDDGVLVRMAGELIDETVRHACLVAPDGGRRCAAPEPALDEEHVLHMLARTGRPGEYATADAEDGAFELWYPLQMGRGLPAAVTPGPGVRADGARVLVLVVDPAAADRLLTQTTVHAALIVALLALLVVLTVRQVRQTASERELERRLAAERRFAELGRLGSVLAHELRNPLGAIKGFAQLTTRRFEPDDPAREDMDMIVSESTRLERLVDALLLFARPRDPQLRSADLRAVLARVIALARHDAERLDVELEAPPPGDPVLIAADVDQLAQALINLIRNAIQAAADDGGHVRVTLESGEAGHVVAVADDGPGIDPAVRDTLFEPWVTAKATGTGLGLAVTRRIVHGHGGTITVRSGDARSGDAGPDQGTTFEVTLPRSTS